MSEKNIPPENQALQQAIETLQQTDTQENRAKMLEAVEKAKFICPVVLQPAPPRDEKGKAILQPDTKIGLQLIATKDGKKYFMGFTSSEKMAKWNTENHNHDLVVNTFDQFAGLLIAQKNDVAGVIIDPFGGDLTLSRDMIVKMKRFKDRQEGIYSIAKTDRVVMEDPKKPPEEMLAAMTAYCKKKPEINAAFLRLMFHNGNKTYLLILDLKEGTEHKAVFDEISNVAKPFLKHMLLGVVRIQDSLGKKGIENAKPFYKKLFYKIPESK